MTWIVIFNIIAIAFGVVVAAGLAPADRVSGMLIWLHSIIGITPPAPERTRAFAIVWIASTIILVDGLLFLLVFLTTHLM